MANAATATPTPAGEKFRPSTSSSLLTRARRIITGHATFDDRYCDDHARAIDLIEVLRSMDCKIAFTAGVFDMFHIGHGDYMQHGKDAAIKRYPGVERMILVVGVDSDEVVRARKGPNRPVVPMDERCKVLGHVRAVDMIVAQTAENQLYCSLPYDVRIISTSTADLPDESEMHRYCEHLVNLPPQAETSTTARIRQLALEGKVEGRKEGMLEAIQHAESEVGGIFGRLRDGVK